MAKKSKRSIVHPRKKSKNSLLLQESRSIAKARAESLMTKGGYVSVRVVVKTEGKVGTSTMPKLVFAKASDPRSVSIFIAGGSEVDRKVALANAKLLNDID